MNYKKLNDVCLNITDGTHATVQDDNNGTCHLLSCKNIKNNRVNISINDRRINEQTLLQLRKRTKMTINDVVLTTIGSIGESCVIDLIDPKYEFQRSCAIIKTDLKQILPQYLNYFFNSYKGQSLIKSRIKGAAQPCLFLNDIKDLNIPIVALFEQQHIVDTILLHFFF